MFRILALILLLAGAAYAQTTNVTGTIVDANGNAYGVNGTVSAVTVVPTGRAATSLGPFPMNSGGGFSLNVASNLSYAFTVCAMPVNIGPLTNPTPTQVCFASPPIFITGATQDISSISSAAPLLGPVVVTAGGQAAGVPNDVQLNVAGVPGSDTGIFTENPSTHIMTAGIGGIVSQGAVSAGQSPPQNCVTGSVCSGQVSVHPIPTPGVNSLDADSGGFWQQTLGLVTVPIPNAFTAPLTMGATGTVSLNTSGVTAGSYTNPNITVNNLGLVTAASNGSPQSGTPNVGVSFTSVTSVTIPASTSGATSANVLVECYDTSAPAKRIVPGSVTVDTGTFQVVVSFNQSTSGFCTVNNSGPAVYSASLAAASSFSILATTHKLGTHVGVLSLIDPQGNNVIPGNVTIDSSGNVTITNNYSQSFKLTLTN